MININWLNLDEQAISDLLCCALEGGSNYWYLIDRVTYPQEWTFNTHDDKNKHYYQDFPLNEGGALIILDTLNENKEYTLDREKLVSGLNVMSGRYPHHFADVIAENADATTGDVFLQCCLFGEAIYG